MSAVMEALPKNELKRRFTEALKNHAEMQAIYDARRAALDENIKILTEAWEADNRELIFDRDSFRSDVEQTESLLRQLAMEHYAATGEKTLDENLGVRVATKYEYEQALAVQWAELNAPIMIVKSVDKKAFESLPTVNELPFVHKIESPSAVIKGLK